MSAIFRPAEGNRASYYDVRYKEKDTGKWKHAKFATNMYGKYTKEIAEYAVTNGVEGKFKTRITDQKLAFLESGEEVAYLSNKELYITNATILDTMNIGTITIVPSKKDGSKCGIMFLWKG